ncbi:MAG TPA: ABC transporter ATP-binding protein/permease [Candidatus Ornithospirochaeta avicola]|uniref:ABC transporter ATP-binding protein/permease n=1 Tax=Candidatus Ornithospirochaeta avicola TaxID=2840896 RepID=A0A9D1PT40_9SPIO|nr:ABC transporter ATP-binding protein/permease [Candidatus Ornithospirochaeta avicola]
MSKKYAIRAKNPSKTIKRLFAEVFSEHKAKLALVFVCIVLSAYGTSYAASFMQTLIDDCISPMIGVANPSLEPLIRALAEFGILIVLTLVIPTFIVQRVMIKIAQGAIFSIRCKMFKKMESLPISYFDTHTHGETMSRFSNDTDTLNQMVGQALTQVATATLTLIFLFVSMIMNSWILTVLVVLFSIITVKTMAHIASRSGRYFGQQQADLGVVNGFIEEMMNGQRVIKVFTHEEESKKDFDRINEKLFSSMSKANGYSNSIGPVGMNLGNIQYVLLVLAGSILIILMPGYTVGALAAFLLLSRNMSNNVNQISQQANSVLLALAGAERIFELLDEEAEKDEGYVTLVNAKVNEDGSISESAERTGFWAWKHIHQDKSPTTYVPLKGDIVMKDVDFGYVPEKTVLHDISLYAKPGQKIAFVGATGAGKTTITNLLNRFYDIQDGKIRFDGININKIKKDDLRHSLGMILQDTNLFTGSIKDNIRFGRLDASDDDVIRAAKLANAHDFIMHLPDGYDTMITNNGEGLSQGQRQLLSIARAAVADPPVMVMDEATSSIDTHTEALVQAGMDRIMQNRTVFVIAHRLSTVRNSDAIMVLDHGRIIERGTHEQLLEQKGVYYQLYTGAFELS